MKAIHMTATGAPKNVLQLVNIPEPEITAPHQIKVQLKAANKVDIIWVIDQSPSMLDDQQAIAANLNAFAQYMMGQNLDFQVIVIATRNDYNEPDPFSGVGKSHTGVCIPQPLAEISCVNVATDIDRDAPSPRLDVCGQGLDAHSANVFCPAHRSAQQARQCPGADHRWVNAKHPM